MLARDNVIVDHDGCLEDIGEKTKEQPRLDNTGERVIKQTLPPICLSQPLRSGESLESTSAVPWQDGRCQCCPPFWKCVPWCWEALHSAVPLFSLGGHEREDQIPRNTKGSG